MTINSEYIKEIKSMNTGGGMIVDLVILKNGTCLGISDECVCLYPNEEAFYDGDDILGDPIYF